MEITIEEITVTIVTAITATFFLCSTILEASIH